jgi:NAD(P)-dependent dehydrogenase (short-subunit alcohol dehydrogenase family)
MSPVLPSPRSATPLKGRTALVTGAATGLGRAIAEELAVSGADVAVLDIDGPGAEATAAHLATLGVVSRAYTVDVSNAEAVDEAFSAVHRDFGRMDATVNNAGVSFVGPHVRDTTDEDWARVVAVMQTGVFYCMRAAARIMLPQGSGSVVNISSIRGYSPNPGRISYCAVKAAVLMMTRVAAGEWAPFGVRANAIAPGIQQTPMWDHDVALGVCDEELVLRATPAGRLGQPWEVGRLAVYLCSDDATFVNGACISIDGGLTSVPADGKLVRPGDA